MPEEAASSMQRAWREILVERTRLDNQQSPVAITVKQSVRKAPVIGFVALRLALCVCGISLGMLLWSQTRAGQALKIGAAEIIEISAFSLLLLGVALIATTRTALATFPRTIVVANHRLKVQMSNVDIDLDTADCRWTCGRVSSDRTVIGGDRREALIVVARLRSLAEGRFAVGISAAERDHWKQCFQDQGIAEIPGSHVGVRAALYLVSVISAAGFGVALIGIRILLAGTPLPVGIWVWSVMWWLIYGLILTGSQVLTWDRFNTEANLRDSWFRILFCSCLFGFASCAFDFRKGIVPGVLWGIGTSVLAFFVMGIWWCIAWRVPRSRFN